MFFKRMFAIIICIVFVFNLCNIFAFAAANDTAKLEKVLASVKTRIPDTSVFTEFDSETRNENGRIVYSFSWNDDNDRRMYVSALESGVIVDYGFREIIRNEEPPKGFDRIPTEEAIRRTQSMVNNLNPQIAGKVFVEAYNFAEDFNSDRFNFRLVHKEGGVPVKNDMGRVVVDIDAKKIASFNLNYTEGLKYVTPHNILSRDKAKQAFENEIGMTLAYHIYKDYEKRAIKVFPAYSDRTSNVFIDANTGKAVEVDLYSDLYLMSGNASAEKFDESSRDELYSEAELKELENLDNLISASEAEKLLRSNKLLKISGDFVVEETVLQKDIYQKDKYTRNILFGRTNSKGYECINVCIDAKTGEVLGFSDFTSEETAKKYTNSQLKAEADRIFKELAPEKFDEYIFNEDMDSNGYFCYVRHINGIPVLGDTVSIELNQSNADLMSYRMNYTVADFPLIDKAISHSEACNALFENTDYNPTYIPQKTDKDLKCPDTTVLVYATEESGIIIDAYTGQRITVLGTVYNSEDEFEEYTDITGHYVEEKIRALHRFGIGFAGELFKPEQKISQAEFLKLCEQAFGGVLSISDLKSPAANILTRIEAARLVCKILNLDKLAEIEKIYKCPFKDVEEGKGYVSLLWGLEIVSGTDKDKFSPNDGLSRAQAASLIYNTMDKGF